MKQRLRLSLIMGVVLLPGCGLYTKPEVPPTHSPELFKVSLDEERYKALNNRWWENFNDSHLNELVEKAIEKNYSYLVALQNIDIAQTYVLQNMTLLFPQVGLDYALSRNKSIINVGNATSSAPELTGANAIMNLQLLTASVSYEIDAWNQVHNSVDQAKADTQTAQGNTNVIRLTLISTVVNTYYQIMALNQNIANLRKQHKAATEILDLTEVRYKSGLVSDSDVLLASNNAETILSTLKTSEKQKQILDYTMAYLLGEYPEQFNLEVKGKLKALKFAELVPEAIPSQVVAVRPDIQAAFTSILSFGYIEKQNIANFLPSLSLSGTYGYSNSRLSHLINPTNVLWNFGLSAVQAVIDYPALYAQWKRSQIQYEQAINAYKNTVVNAYAEVDGAMVSYKEDNLVRESFDRQLYNSKELFGIAKAHYKSGLTNYIDYLTNDLNMLQADYNLTLKELTLAQDVVQLYKAMGLGIQDYDI